MIIDDHVFFIKRNNLSLRGAYKFFGVRKGSYIGSIVQRIYDYYCRDATNLYYMYCRYYRKEFYNFSKYLEGHYNLFPEEVERLNSKRLCYKDLSFQPESNLTNLLEDLSIVNTLKKFLGDVEEAKDED